MMSKWTWKHLKQYSHAYLIVFIGLLISFSLFFALQRQEQYHLVSIAQLGTETIDNNIRAELSINERILKELRTLAAQGKPSPQAIRELIKLYPRVYLLAEASSATKLSWLAAPNASPVFEHIVEKFLQMQGREFKNLTDFWVSTPVALPGGKLGFFMVYPYKTSFFLALIDSKSLLQHSTNIPGMNFDIYLNQEALSLDDNDDKEDKSPWILQVSQTINHAFWEIKARETSHNLGLVHFIGHEAPLSWLTLVLGLFISILLARSTALSDLLKERAAMLDKTNQDLKNEITEHAQTEESKKVLEKALLQGQKLQAMGTLAGGIAHDFNNILYAIRGYIELARDDVQKETTIHKNLGKVLTATLRGQDLVARILSFSRRQPQELSPLLLKTEIEGALALLRPTIPESVELKFQASTEGRILGNKTQTHQIIVNLINNAVDAMDSEGVISIILSNADLNDLRNSKLTSFSMNNYCKIEISDTGHGMDQTTMERIFEPFFTTKEVGKGTGLGLSTVHTIVKGFNGEIIVKSQPGHGTTFTLFFPQYSGTEEVKKHG